MPVKGERPARFDTVVVMQGKDAEATGLQGEYIPLYQWHNVIPIHIDILTWMSSEVIAEV